MNRELKLIRRLFLIYLYASACISCKQIPKAEKTNESINIIPDYKDITVPCNIAPLNFYIVNKGNMYYVKIADDKENCTIKISSKNGKIQIPAKKWKKMLEANKGGNIYYEIFIRNKKKKWKSYKRYGNSVSPDSIDSYIAYRKIGTANILWNKMGIYQRCLENYKETPIITNNLTNNNCMNCHSFNHNDPNQMMLHMRMTPGGTVIYTNGGAIFLNTTTNYTMSAGVYPSWHPSGKYIAFSVNKIKQRFHSSIDKYVIVMDKASDIILLDIENRMITTSPKLSTKRLENIPCWSPDGKYLYYISGNEFDTVDYKNNKYDLMRIPFDEEILGWGEPDTILTAKEAGKSLTFPRISPDGKYLLFCMTETGYFTVYNKDADVYLMNLETKEYKRLSVNSDFVDSYPVWSKNGKWIMFVSKRDDNKFSRPWFSNIDQKGNVTKPFVLPQKDGDFYDSYILNFNRTEFITGKVKYSPRDIYKLSNKEAKSVTFDPGIDIDELSGATHMSKSSSTFYLND